MKKEKKNFIWNVIGLSFNAFISFFLLIIVKRINGIDLAGIFTYAFSLSCLFYISCCFYSRTFQVSDYKNEFLFKDYFVSRLIFDIINLIIVLLFSFVSGFDSFKILVIGLLMIYKCIEALCDSIFGQMQKEGNLYRTGISYTLKSIIGMIVFLIIDLFTNNLILSISGLIIINTLVLFLYDIPSLKEKFPRLNFNKEKFLKLLLVSFPVFIYTFLQNYLSNSQKVVMTYFIDNDLQTIFGILIMPATMLILVGNYIILPFINDLTNKFKNKDYKSFNKIVNKMCISLLLIGALCVLIAFFLGIPVLNFIYNINLEQYKYLLLIILAGSIFNALSMVFSNVLTVLTVNKRQTIIYIVMSIVCTGITICLAHYYGMEGLCYSYSLTVTLLSIIYFFVYKLYIRKIEKQLH